MASQLSKSAPQSSVGASMLLDDQLCFALYAATHSIQRLYRPLLDNVGLTYPQYLVMLVLWEQDGLAVSAIGDKLSLRSATLTPLLKRLEATNIVERRRSTTDERRVEVFVTAAGLALKQQVQQITTDVTCAAAAAADDAEALRDSLRTLRDALPGSL